MNVGYPEILLSLKRKKRFVVSVKKYNSLPILLRVITYSDIENDYLIRQLSAWRIKHANWFPSIFTVTQSRTKKWLKNLVVENPDRILFAIQDEHGKMYGHLGFYRWRKSNNSCELDSVVRGSKSIPGLMTECVRTLVDWGFKNLNVNSIFLTTFADNDRAVDLYIRCGFKKLGRIPLRKVIREDEIVWERIPRKLKVKPQRYYQRMVLRGNA